MCENLIDQLKLLNYETTFCREKDYQPLEKTFFAIQGKPSEQFPVFSTLVGWMLSELGHQFTEWNEYDDASSVSTNIWQESKAVGFQGDFPPGQLKPGHGQQVLQVMDFLAAKLLQHRGFRIQQPDYSAAKGSGDQDDVADGDDDLDGDIDDLDEDIADDEEEEANDSGDDYGAYYAEQSRQNDAGEAGEAPVRYTMPVLESKVDASEWALELERVAHQLRFKPQSDAKEWRTHMTKTQTHSKILESELPLAEKHLNKIAAQLKKTVERISSKERHINKEFETLASDFREKQSTLDEVTGRHNEFHSAVSELTQELSQVSDDVDMIKSQMSNRNDSMTDMSPLRRIRTALQQLREEIDDMELKIGVSRQALLASKVREQKHSTSKAKHRINSSKTGAGARPDSANSRRKHRRKGSAGSYRNRSRW